MTEKDKLFGQLLIIWSLGSVFGVLTAMWIVLKGWF